MSALLLQIGIGFAGLLLGLVLGGLRGRGRVLRARAAAQQQVDDLQSGIAMKRFRIRELEAKVEELTMLHEGAARAMRVTNGATRPRPAATPMWLDAGGDPGSRSAPPPA